MNEENEWEEIADAATVEGQIESGEKRDNGGAQAHWPC